MLSPKNVNKITSGLIYTWVHFFLQSVTLVMTKDKRDPKFNKRTFKSNLGPLYMKAELSFIPGWISSRDEKSFILHERVHPGMLGRKSSRPSWIHLARAYITLYFIPERLFTWRFSSRFIPGWHFNSVFHPGMKSSRDEFIPGRNHISSCKQQQENDQTPRWIHPGTKVIPGRKLSCKEALSQRTLTLVMTKDTPNPKYHLQFCL